MAGVSEGEQDSASGRPSAWSTQDPGAAPGAVSGDILVDRGVFGVGRLSNAFPIDLTPANPGTDCTGKVNSSGSAPAMDSSGTPSLNDDDFWINVNTALGQKNMSFFEGFGQAAIPFFNGTLCTAPPLKRGPIQTTDFSSFASLPIPFLPADVGAQHNLQTWIRDPRVADGTGVALTNAIQYVVLPGGPASTKTTPASASSRRWPRTWAHVVAEARRSTLRRRTGVGPARAQRPPRGSACAPSVKLVPLRTPLASERSKLHSATRSSKAAGRVDPGRAGEERGAFRQRLA